MPIQDFFLLSEKGLNILEKLQVRKDILMLSKFLGQYK